MISRSTIDRVMDTARIEEVVGDFVTLKKRGGNYIGLCPFHNEKSPSFTVTPAKGIYKCFGCGASGNSVGFLMEHEHLTYPDAIRQLAQRYNLEVEEETRVLSEQHKQELSERDRQYALHAFAQQYFHLQLTETDDGRAIGLSYFKERGITDESIAKFGLGYSPDSFDALSRMALGSEFSQQELEASGLSIHTQSDKLMDRFRGRVIFPFYNLSGKVIGFGGRILKNDKKEAKYLNSPETLLYKKSETLYGLFQAKKAIQKQENCYLVEGYTDVIGLHQAGIENVAASSGTSLTQEQARLIHRFTKKVTVIYDGDAAGVKASLRGINILLENNLQVSVVPLPEGEDPDSYSRLLGPAAFRDYLAEQTVDFVRFKVNLLLTEAAGDPMKRAEVIHDMAETVSFIGDPIVRATYSSSTASLLDFSESLFIHAVAQHQLNRQKKSSNQRQTYDEIITTVISTPPKQAPILNHECQELGVIQYLLQHGRDQFSEEVTVAQHLIDLLDEVAWDIPEYHQIFTHFEKSFRLENRILTINDFYNFGDAAIKDLAIFIYSINHEMSSNWDVKHSIIVPSKEQNLIKSVEESVNMFNLKKLEGIIKEKKESLKTAESDELIDNIQLELMELNEYRKVIAKKLGIVVSKYL